MAICLVKGMIKNNNTITKQHNTIKMVKGDLQTIFRFFYLKVYKVITMGMKFKNL